MAMTHDYLDYLDQNVGIAPANSQEEYQAAETIAEIMRRHDVEPSIEEFDAKAFGGVIDQVLFAAMFVGMLLVGIGVTVLTVIGFILVAVPMVLFVMRYLGNDVTSKLGPNARSQNVVAYHKGEGPLVQKGVRPIVIVAHYDTPHENPVYTSPVGPYLPTVWSVSKWCCLAVAVATLIQVLGFLPGPFRRVIWVIGLLTSLPLLLLAVTGIIELFTPSTEGANDNKTGVAAMLGILENVRPSGEQSAYPANEDPADWAPAEPDFGAVSSYDEIGEKPVPSEGDARGEDPAAGDAAGVAVAAPAAEPQWRPVPVEGVRHGADVLRSLGMLPEDCEIEYLQNVMEQVPAEEATDVTGAAPATAAASAAPVAAGETASFSPVDGADTDPDATVLAPNPDATAEVAPVIPSEQLTGEPNNTVPSRPVASGAGAGATREDLMSTGRFSLVADDGDAVQAGDGDASGFDSLGDADATQPTPATPRPRPAAPDDPEWGKTSFRPQVANPARRASLFDLPNPGEDSVDPFATDPRGQVVKQAPAAAPTQPATVRRATAVPAPQPAQPVAGAQAIGTISAGDLDAAAEPEQGRHRFGGFAGFGGGKGEKSGHGLRDKISKLGGAFGHKKDADDEPREDWLGINDDENWSDNDGGWKGGAAPRAGLRLVEDEAPAGAAAEGANAANGADASVDVVPTDDDLRDAVLAMNDDELICHDVWFVALGASGLGHAGMKAFLAQHRKQIRGAFVVNLDSIGAGELTMFTREGMTNPRRADRRMVRSLARTASDLHIRLAQKDHEWGSTDATPSMRAHVRSITLTGLDPSGMKALSGTPSDVVEHVNPARAAQVATLVTEMIRRS